MKSRVMRRVFGAVVHYNKNEDFSAITAEQESMHDYHDATTESDNTPTSASVLICNDLGYLNHHIALSFLTNFAWRYSAQR